MIARTAADNDTAYTDNKYCNIYTTGSVNYSSTYKKAKASDKIWVVSSYNNVVYIEYKDRLKKLEQSIKELEWIDSLKIIGHFTNNVVIMRHRNLNRIPIPYRMDRLIGKREKRIGRKS